MSKSTLAARQKKFDDKVGKPLARNEKGLPVVAGAFHRPGSNKK